MSNPFYKILELQSRKLTDAQVALNDGILSLLSQKKPYEIGVKELCQTCHVARSTFYVYYQNVDELIEEIENRHIISLFKLNNDIMAKKSLDDKNIAFYHETILFVEANKKLFYVFLVGNPNFRFQNKWKEAIKYHLWERICVTKEVKNVKLILEMTASEVLAAYSYWLQHPYDVDVKHVNKVIMHTLGSLDNIS